LVKRLPESLDNLSPLRRGNLNGFALVKPASERMSRTYFLLFKKVPLVDLEISIPRKYLARPISVIVNA